MKITKYTNLYGIVNAVRRYSKEFPNISESTVRGWLKKFRGELTRKVPSEEVVISKKRGRPLYLPEELDEKLRTFLIAQRRPGGNINRHTIYGVLMGLIKCNLPLYGGYLEFTATDGWPYSLYKRMNFVRRTVTTSRPVVTEALWIEIRTLFLPDICTLLQTYNIPDELINVDQTPSK